MPLAPNVQPEVAEKRLNSLLDEVSSLTFKDEQNARRLLRDIRHQITLIFVPNDRYVSDIDAIRFVPYLYLSNKELQASWDGASTKLVGVLKRALEDVALFKPATLVAANPKRPPKTRLGSEISTKGRKVFIVHGHDEAKHDIARVSEKLKLETIILDDEANRGRALLTKFLEHSTEARFAIVLLTPDDMGYEVSGGADAARPRPRQNVVFELGFFLGKLGPGNVVALYRDKENFEIPTDYQGIAYIPYDSNGGWKLKLVRELNAAGIEADARLLA